MSADTSQAGYVVPTYRAPDETPWYHFLHGNVPGHQIDFMYRAEVPQGPLMRQHFSHLARLMKYIEPQAGCPYAFAIGNLSRDDTQHEPGHGGVALMFGLRIQGVTDHAGRQDPPFAHAVATIDRKLDRSELLAAAGVFHRHVLAAAQSAEWYRSYVRCAAEAPAGMADVLADYVAGFKDLPSPPQSSLGLKWTVGESTPPARVVIVHDDDAPFGLIAECAAKIAAVLFPSDIRWSAISNGREADLPNGVTVRLVAASNVTPADEAKGVHRIEDVPDDEAELARKLFGVSSAREAITKPIARGWRDKYAGASAGGDESGLDPQRPSFTGEPPPRRSSVSLLPALPSYDAAGPNPLERTKPGIGAQRAAPDEIEIDMSSPVSERVSPMHARSTPPPSQGNRVAKIDVPAASPAPSPTNDDLGPAETRTLTAGLELSPLKPALPFAPASATAPAPVVTPFTAVPEIYNGPLPTFKPALRWKGPALGIGLGAIVLVVLYLLLNKDPESPTPTPAPLPPPTSEAPAQAPTVAALPSVEPTSVPTATQPPAPTAAAAASTATTPRAPPKLRSGSGKVGKKPDSGGFFGGGI
jgi:hypothetical protein